MKTWREAIVHGSAKLRTAIETLDRSGLQIVLVVDDDGRLRGSVTDGDIRRGILKGTDLDAPVSSVMNRRPTTAGLSEPRESLLALMKRRHIRQIPLLDKTGCIVGLEVMDDILTVVDRPNLVLLMAGGLGTRLRPLTDDRPKPLLELGNKPILETIIDKCASYGLTRFAISVNYKADMIQQHFGDGSAWDVEITYLREDERLGTGGGTRPPGSTAAGAGRRHERRSGH